MLCTYSEHRYCHRDVRCQFRYGNPDNYSTGTVIATKDVSTGMVIKKNNSTSTVIVTSVVSTGMAIRNMTVPVLSSIRLKSMPVWYHMVIPNNLSTHNDISIPITSLKKLTLPVLYVVFWSDTGKVRLRVWWSCFCSTFTGKVPLKNNITGMGSITGTVRGITGNVILRVW